MAMRPAEETAEGIVSGRLFRVYLWALLAVPVLLSVAALSLLVLSAFGVHPLWRVRKPTLMDAIRIGDRDGLRQMLAAGADPNAPLPFRHPELFEGKRLELAPLVAAAALGEARVVAILLEGGAPARGRAGGEAVCAAARYGRYHAVEVLLEAGAPVNADCGGGRTPLRLAEEAGHGSLSAFIKKAGGRDGRTLMEVIRMGDRSRVREKLAEGADPNRQEAFLHPKLFGGKRVELPPLVAAAALGENHMIEALVKAGAAVRGPMGGEALCAAARNGRVDAAQALLSAGAPVNVDCGGGRTPLRLAREGDHGPVARILEKAGAREDR